MFATNIELSLLAESDTWYSDGNFSLAPEFFIQLYVIRVQKKSVFVTAIYCKCEKLKKPHYDKWVFLSFVSVDSTHRILQKISLETIYKEDSEFRKYCGMIDSLAFLPLDKVLDGLTRLKENIPPHAENLLFYFYYYYVNGTYRLVGTASFLRLRKIPSIFPPSTWNVHELTLKDRHHTNNTTEGWNNRFSKLCCHKHPTIWNLIKKIKRKFLK
ncbi:hypothetical protein AGLY_000879 [Aphis glycines]|uniref:Uncharacterized protein n=1 Tax=Aphis glycines TaxID=307491 RepID=A0A6G0UAR7_APHGL|nr:hypothetical protein AGLY_000879 [Aphis glycines]